MEGGAKVQRLHALDLTTGAEKFGGPATIAASVSGTANDGAGGKVTFNAGQENQRPGLLLLNGIVYIGWTAHEDIAPWHGWIIAYNAGTLQQTSAFCASPNGFGSGLWMSGNGLAADQVDAVNHPYGRMFVATGNGDYTATKPYSNVMDYGDSHLALDLTNGVLAVTDEFTTNQQATDNTKDLDVGSGGVMVVPTQTVGSFPHVLVQSDKSGNIYLLNRDNLGGYNIQTNQALQILPAALAGTWSSPAYWNGTVYFWGMNDHLKAFQLVNGLLSPTPAQSAEVYGFPGATPAISANGTADAIVWTVNSAAFSTGAAVLQAHSASNVATTLYSSNTNANRDQAGVAVKFSVPTVANGKVFVGAVKELDVYGLLSTTAAAAAPTFTPGAGTYTSAQTVTIADATPGAKIYYTTNGTTPTTASTLYSGPVTVSASETLQAIATASGYTTSGIASAAYTIGSGTTAAATPMFTPGAGTYTSPQSVTIIDATPGAKIYYTTNGTTPTTASTLYTGPVTVSVSEPLEAIATATSYTNSRVGGAAYTISSAIAAAAPTFTPGAGTYTSAQTVTIADATPGAKIYYTTNGTTPTTASTLYSGPVTVSVSETLQAIATASGYTTSGIASAAYTIGSGTTAAATPMFTPGAGTYTSPQSVTIIDATPGAKIYYTTNGTTPTTASTLYTGPVTVSVSEPLEAIATATGYTNSRVGGAAYTISSAIAAAAPTFTPGAGTYTSAQTVTIADATPGAKIYYTTNGTTPTTASTLYSGPVTVSASETLQAIATASGYTTSAIASAAYNIGNSAAPVINDPAGFSSSAGLSFVASAALTNGTLQLSTASGGIQANAVWYATPVNVQSFTTDFTFQLTSATGDGFTFALQNVGANALGKSGGSLGYQGIGASVAIKFDLYDNSGEGLNSTGFYTYGAAPMMPAADLTPSGVNLHSGNPLHAHITYDGTTLSLTLTDTVTLATFSTSTVINIAAVVGANTAYAGFTAGTYEATANQSVLNWTYTAN